ncbi:hypothetical protein MC885_004812 [Smutsia gigantea]|nr:hypothetical protein MC885_004812 [Smutsia gigantea]
MPVVSLEPAATSLGASVPPDLLSANNPRPGKAKAPWAPWPLSSLAAPGRGPAGGCLLPFSPPPGNLRRSSSLGVHQSVGCWSPRTEAEVSGKGPGLRLSPWDWLSQAQTSAYTVGCCLVQDPECLRTLLPRSSGGGVEWTETRGVTSALGHGSDAGAGPQHAFLQPSQEYRLCSVHRTSCMSCCPELSQAR